MIKLRQQNTGGGQMQIGLIGLGRMGYNLALNMKDHGHNVVAFNRTAQKTEQIEREGIKGAYSLEELFQLLAPPRVVWMMIPNGKPVDDMIEKLVSYIEVGDILIDGGNSFYGDTLNRHQLLKEKGIQYVDAGTSGGISGARHGACLMVGGEKEAVQQLDAFFTDIATKDGYAHVGGPGSGHFVKMVHNGVEYGMMQAIGEGFDVLKASEFNLNYEQVGKVWSNGSIIEGQLMRNVYHAFEKDHQLDRIEGVVDASGEGQWTVETALKLGVSTPIIAGSLFARYKSKDEQAFAEKVVAAMRNEFGGHAVYKKKV